MNNNIDLYAKTIMYLNVSDSMQIDISFEATSDFLYIEAKLQDASYRTRVEAIALNHLYPNMIKAHAQNTFHTIRSALEKKIKTANLP